MSTSRRTTLTFILEGHAKVTLHMSKISILGPGDLVGEIAPVGHRLRTATVTALEPLHTLAFTAEVFNELREQLPRFDQHVTDIALARINELERSTEE